MTKKRKDFLRFYAQNGDIGEAARLAGYKTPIDRLPALVFLVKEGLGYADGEGCADKIASPAEVMEQLTQFMRGELEALEREPPTKERLRAAELLGKSYGMFGAGKAEAGEGEARVVIAHDYGE